MRFSPVRRSGEQVGALSSRRPRKTAGTAVPEPHPPEENRRNGSARTAPGRGKPRTPRKTAESQSPGLGKVGGGYVKGLWAGLLVLKALGSGFAGEKSGAEGGLEVVASGV